VVRKPISSLTKLMLGPPETNVTLGFKCATSQMIDRVSLWHSVPAKASQEEDVSDVVVYDNNLQLRHQVDKAKEEHLRGCWPLSSVRDLAGSGILLFGHRAFRGARYNRVARARGTAFGLCIQDTQRRMRDTRRLLKL
jgi:hypothetical protein